MRARMGVRAKVASYMHHMSEQALRLSRSRASSHAEGMEPRPARKATMPHWLLPHGDSNSADWRAPLGLPSPPVTSTLPLFSNVAVCPLRPSPMNLSCAHVPVSGL